MYGQILMLILIVAIGSLIADYIKDYLDVWIMNRRFSKIDEKIGRKTKNDKSKRRWHKQP